jgi:hypothetical protein
LFVIASFCYRYIVPMSLHAGQIRAWVLYREQGVGSMKTTLMALTALGAAAAVAGTSTGTAAQVVLDLSGTFQCVQGCVGNPAALAYVTQNGWELKVVNEAGVPTRAWIDWPGHVWLQDWNEGALYSPDGMTIQFDRGTVWRRFLN